MALGAQFHNSKDTLHPETETSEIVDFVSGVTKVVATAVCKAANKLANPVRLVTNLGKGNNTTFDGSNDTEIGVTGVLPVANGGTGSNTLDDVPTDNSTNMVNSGAIKKYIDNNGGILVGCIMPFSGTFSGVNPINKKTNKADTKWHICDGTGGTPDLRGKFVLGASSTHAIGSTGGVEAVPLKQTELPAHTHSFSGTTNTTGAHNHGFPGDDQLIKFSSVRYNLSDYDAESQGGFSPRMYNTTTDGNHTHTFSGTTGSTGSGAAHENMPPYYTLSYIMYIG